MHTKVKAIILSNNRNNSFISISLHSKAMEHSAHRIFSSLVDCYYCSTCLVISQSYFVEIHLDWLHQRSNFP